MPPKGAKILLDQCVPRTIYSQLGNFSFSTAFREGWSDEDDEPLLRLASEAGFVVIVTADQSMMKQQNLATLKISIITLGTNDAPTLSQNVAKIRQAIQSVMRSPKHITIPLVTPLPRRK
jgi:predicted nuclease of predicted toxin-antitoxin system